jgi:FkbM family methyltransferase
MSTYVRQVLLKGLQVLGVKSFTALSGLGYPFLCHVGDFAGEVAFYNRTHSQTEIECMAKWCRRFPDPLVFDIGANVGFVATQLAQATKTADCRIFAFEAVHQTFEKLTESIRVLGLQSQIVPVCCAVSEQGDGVCSIAFNPRESLFAQVRQDALNLRAGTSLAWCSIVTLDAVAHSIGRKPTLLKIDVEGHEAHVLRGARGLLRAADAPVICFELNPTTLGEVGSSAEAVAAELGAYECYYLDDFEGQKLPLGHEIADMSSLTWPCNVLAAPRSVSRQEITALFN